MRELINRAIAELKQEGLLNENLKITEQGKTKAENLISKDELMKDKIFNHFWQKISNDFYEDEPLNYVLKILKLEKLLKKSDINLYEKLLSFKNNKNKKIYKI